jgi:hypothetical protein
MKLASPRSMAGSIAATPSVGPVHGALPQVGCLTTSSTVLDLLSVEVAFGTALNRSLGGVLAGRLPLLEFVFVDCEAAVANPDMGQAALLDQLINERHGNA